MKIIDIVWLPHILDKIIWKHGVTPEEVEDVLFGKSLFRKVQKGYIPGDYLYAALGKSTEERYLIIFFIYRNPDRRLL